MLQFTYAALKWKLDKLHDSPFRSDIRLVQLQGPALLLLVPTTIP